MRFLSVALLLALIPFVGNAQETSTTKFVFKEQAQGPAKLRYINSIPVLVIEGSPAEVGDQYGKIAIAQTKDLLGKVDGFVEKMGWKSIYPLMLKASAGLLEQFPKDYRTEVDAAAKSSGVERNLLVLVNCLSDLRKFGACSTFVVQKGRSKTGEPLFGRNLDWPPYTGLAEHSLIVVCKPTGKHAFASLSICPLMGVTTAINDAGLCITLNDIYQTKDKSPNLDLAGTPMLLLLRRVMEECETLDQAEKLIKEAKRTSMFVLTLCDKTGGCVLEVTTKNVVRRNPENDVCCCTNHFRTPELSVAETCPRYEKLEKTQKSEEKLGVPEVIKALDKVNQGKATVHSIVFEPSQKVIHVSISGDESATKKEYRKIELEKLFGK